jgi:hypothetical protein
MNTVIMSESEIAIAEKMKKASLDKALDFAKATFGEDPNFRFQPATCVICGKKPWCRPPVFQTRIFCAYKVGKTLWDVFFNYRCKKCRTEAGTDAWGTPRSNPNAPTSQFQFPINSSLLD